MDSKPEPKPDIVDGNTFTPQNDSVTAKQEVNLRLSPTTSGEIAGVLKNGTFYNEQQQVIKDGRVLFMMANRLRYNKLSYNRPFI